jgi:hypothetical protein
MTPTTLFQNVNNKPAMAASADITGIKTSGPM